MQEYTDANQAFARSQDAQGTLGVWVQPGLGTAFPELKTLLASLYGRVAALPFVPIGWAAQVAALQEANPTSLVRLYPSIGAAGNVNAGIPSWIASERSRAEAWQAVVKAQDAVIFKYAQGKNQFLDPDSELNALLADSEFWNGWAGSALIAINQAARAATEAPGNLVGWMGDGLLSFAGKFLGRTWYLFVIAGVVYVMWTGRGKIARKAASKAEALL